jgi:hypothetical protein
LADIIIIYDQFFKRRYGNNQRKERNMDEVVHPKRAVVMPKDRNKLDSVKQ